LAQGADAVVAVLPSVPPSSNQPYVRGEETGSIRASLQHALDNWTPGQVTLSAPAGADLDRSHTRSFGETHATELQQINTDGRDHSPTSSPSPARVPVPLPVPISIQELGSESSPTSSSQTQQASFSSLLAESSTPSINPVGLNNDPATIPSRSPAVGVTLPGPADTEVKVPSVTPTVAETGVPVTGGTHGPGPSSGSLLDIRSSKSSLSHAVSGTVRTQTKGYESAEEEKKRLEREERERLLRSDAPSTSTGSSAPTYESAEDEKKRLEREERERLLHDQREGGGPNPEDEGDTPPPYQDM
jgi:hypothetical protein